MLGAILQIDIEEQLTKADHLHKSLILQAIDHKPQSMIKIKIDLTISQSIVNWKNNTRKFYQSNEMLQNT